MNLLTKKCNALDKIINPRHTPTSYQTSKRIVVPVVKLSYPFTTCKCLWMPSKQSRYKCSQNQWVLSLFFHKMTYFEFIDLHVVKGFQIYTHIYQISTNARRLPQNTCVSSVLHTSFLVFSMVTVLVQQHSLPISH